MQVATKHWGILEIAEDALVRFPNGLFGFEDLHTFAMIEVEEYRPFLWFLSTEDPEVGFAVADPFYFTSGPYELHLSPGDELALELEEGDTLALFVIVTLREGGRQITGNLKGPIVLNTRNRRAKQAVLYGSSYSVSQPLIERTVLPFPGRVEHSAAKAS